MPEPKPLKLTKPQLLALQEIEAAGGSRSFYEGYPPIGKLLGFGLISEEASKYGSAHYVLTAAGEAHLKQVRAAAAAEGEG